jgi:chromosome segregation ATPase
MEKEGEEDEEVFEKMGCWCVTNEKAKTKSIADAEQAISDLTSAIEELTAISAKLNTEVAMLEKEMAKNTEALDSATAMREKELAEFNAEEKETITTVGSLKGAVIALSKHHEASAFLQEATATNQKAQVKLWSDLKQRLHKQVSQLDGLFTPHQKKKVFAFVQEAEQHGSFAPASGEIFGILKQMKESFETNLANSQKEETQAQSDYEELKKAKEDEIAAASDLIDTKSNELATADEKNAQSKEMLEDNRNVLAADTKFLGELKMQCQNIDQEYEERVKTRQLEIQACSKALAFLSSDEAHELFSRTLGFVQVRSTQRSARRDQVSKALKKVSQKFDDPQVAMLATKARLDAFGEVKSAIKEMVDKLTKEKADEIKHKDWCIEELNSNEKDTDNKKRDKSDLDAKIDDLGMTIDTLDKDIETLKAEVTELTSELKIAGEDREKQNKEFQVVVADQRATQKLLAAALDILKGFYDKAALLQKSAGAAKNELQQAPPPGFAKQEKSAASGGVMGMMEGIIKEAKAMEAEAIHGEETAQTAYEEFVTDTNDSLEEKNKDITNKMEMKSEAESDKVQAEAEKEAVMGEIEQLANEGFDLHKSCDFTLKNFEVRQAAREDEIDALKQAMAMFSGASFSAFLQNPQ